VEYEGGGASCDGLQGAKERNGREGARCDGEARRRVASVSGMRYTRIRLGSQRWRVEEEWWRSQGEDGVVVVDGSEEAEGGRQGVAVYTYIHTHTGSPRPRSGYLNNSQPASTRQGTQSASLRARGRISTPGQARETTICSGSASSYVNAHRLCWLFRRGGRAAMF
jgi:hypothetical protein